MVGIFKLALLKSASAIHEETKDNYFHKTQQTVYFGGLLLLFWFYFFLRQGLSLLLHWLVWNSLCRPGLPQTPRDPFATFKCLMSYYCILFCDKISSPNWP